MTKKFIFFNFFFISLRNVSFSTFPSVDENLKINQYVRIYVYYFYFKSNFDAVLKDFMNFK